jgi:hypothetical protein
MTNHPDINHAAHPGFGGVIGQRRTPMSGHATVVEATSSLDEALAHAGLDYTVTKRPLWYTGTGKGSKPVKVDGQFAVVREDNGAFLGAVTGRYTPVQNRESFGWAEGLGEFVFGGAMAGGASAYLGVRLDEKVSLAGDDHDVYAVLWNGHGGRRGLGSILTPTRMRCMNQLPTMRFKATAEETFTSTHSGDAVGRASRQKGIIDGLKSAVSQAQALADELSAVKLVDGRVDLVLRRAMPTQPRLRAAIETNLATSETLDDEQRTTGWGLYNAATEYLELMRRPKSREAALQAMLDGDGARTMARIEAAIREVAV